MTDEQLPAPKPKKKHKRKPKGSRQRAESTHGGTAFAEKFAIEWYRCRNYAEAAKAAGSSAKTVAALRQIGYKTYHLPEVQALLADLRAESVQNAVASRDDLLAELRLNSRLARADKQYTASNRAIELHGKESHGMFGDKLDVRIRCAVEDTFEMLRAHLKPETYRELIGAYKKAVAFDSVASASDAGDRATDQPH